MTKLLTEYRKAITPALLALAGVGVTYIANGYELDRVSLAVGVAGLLQTTVSWITSNVPGWPFAKALLGALAGSIVAFQGLIATGEWGSTETAALASSLALAVITYGVPNGGRTTKLGSFPVAGAEPEPPPEIDPEGGPYE